MKNKLFILSFRALAILCFFSLYGGKQAKAQSEFAPVGANWYYNYSFGTCPECHFNRIVSEKDTIIEGDNCQVLRQYYDNSDSISEEYIIKQEQGKIYYYYQNQFNLLMDFDTQIGDTVQFTFMYQEYDFDKDTVFTARFKVENITTNDQDIKSFEVTVLDEDIIRFYDIPVPPVE